jgi:hypothetical protein
MHGRSSGIVSLMGCGYPDPTEFPMALGRPLNVRLFAAAVLASANGVLPAFADEALVIPAAESVATSAAPAFARASEDAHPRIAAAAPAHAKAPALPIVHHRRRAAARPRGVGSVAWNDPSHPGGSAPGRILLMLGVGY